MTKTDSIVEKQLGRPPSCEYTVARQCNQGFPLVIKNATTTMDGKPFPTTYWLTCPVLRKEISRLESAGALKDMEVFLEYNEQARTEMLERENTLRETRALTPNPLTGVGITGNKEPLKLKCLHAHAADFLAGELNPVGRQTLGPILWPDDCSFCETL